MNTIESNKNFVSIINWDNNTIKEVHINDGNVSGFSGRLVACLNRLDENIEYYFPNNHMQNKLDALGEQIKEKFAPVAEFNQWLDVNGYENFYDQLTMYLVKLPVKSARNVVDQLYQTVTTALYVGLHPVKGMNHLAKTVIQLLDTLTDPQVWPHMGAGALGIAAGTGIALGNPISLTGAAIGGALVLAGVTFDAFLQIFKAEDGKESQAIAQRFQEHMVRLPETVLTGMFRGLLIGGIQRAMEQRQPVIEETDEFHILPIDEDEFHILPIDDVPIIDIKPVQPDPVIIRAGNVAQYGYSDWANHVTTIPHSTIESAKAWAASHPEIDYFFYVKSDIDLAGKVTHVLRRGDAVFFKGEPWWGDAAHWGEGFVVTKG